jgi:hypothetical protein
MSRNYQEDEAPSIGDVKRGHVLVYYGDDSPTQWIDWLEPLVKKAGELISLAEEYGIPIKLSKKANQISSVFDLLYLIGIDIDSEPWTGSLISGIYQYGWIKKGEIRQSKSNAKKIVDQIEAFVDPKIRNAILSEFKNIKNLDEFLERTTPDPNQLLRTIDSQKITLGQLQKNLLELKEDAKVRRQDRLPLFSQQLLELASLIVNPKPVKHIVGPFALWHDGNLYVLRSVGESTLPTDPLINFITQIAADCKRQIVVVHEVSLIGRWLSGPVFRKLGNDLNQWVDAWKCDKKLTREFEATPSEFIDVVNDIAREIAETGIFPILKEDNDG